MVNGVFGLIKKNTIQKIGMHFKMQLQINFIFKISQNRIQRVNCVLVSLMLKIIQKLVEKFACPLHISLT